MCQCLYEMRPARTPPATRRFAHPLGFVELRPKVAGAPHAVLYSQGAPGIRLPASTVLLAGGVLRQPHLPASRGAGQTGERLLDANRTIGQPNKLTVIFGRRISKHYRGKLQTEIEDMDLPNPVIRSHYGNGFVKQYVSDNLMLSNEAARKK